ncbi:helix-turn-helix domain-containing protein [Pedobacter sp. MW01-1-1]|uniref:helix-turn-helix domain-containing protein n=1 Tax=Pedobacter sp. MW01-1-1 TaxID=3383027 RepID=UPI003FF0F4A7
MIQLEKISGLFKREKALTAYFPMRVLVIVEAEGLLCMNSGDYALESGRVFFIPEEGLVRLEGCITSAYWLSFTSFLFAEFLQQHPDPQAKNLFMSLSYNDLVGFDLQKMTKVLDQLKREIIQQRDINYLAQYILLFLGYTSKLDVMLKVLNRDEMEILLRFRAILEQYFRTERTTGFYAVGMGMSANRLNNFLISVLGKNLVQILRERLVRETEVLLLQGDMSLAEIATQFGFKRVSDFNTIFKRYTGTSPTNFVKENNNKIDEL